jgi:hypothetical protein
LTHLQRRVLIKLYVLALKASSYQLFRGVTPIKAPNEVVARDSNLTAGYVFDVPPTTRRVIPQTMLNGA